MIITASFTSSYAVFNTIFRKSMVTVPNLLEYQRVLRMRVLSAIIGAKMVILILIFTSGRIRTD